MQKNVTLEKFREEFLKDIWKAGFREEHPEWKNWDGPYFDDDYTCFKTFEAFLKSSEYEFFMSEKCRCILSDGKPVGMVSGYWKDKKTLWFEIGITIYDSKYWSGGIGTKALKLWIDENFRKYEKLEHIGLTTWSGNIGMMKAAEKAGMKKEAQIRKVRFWKNTYYDSISYGILRSERS